MTHGRPTLNPRIAHMGPSLIREIFDAAPPGCLNMGLGMPDLPVPAVAVEAALAEIQRGLAPYPPNAGWPSLRAAVARGYQVMGAEGAHVGRWLSADGVVVTSGAQEALFVALSALVGPGGAIAVPDPGFPGYAMIATVIGAEVHPYRLEARDGFRPTWSAIEASLRPETRTVVLNSPGNPTGASADPAELQRIASGLAERGLTWVSDEIYDRYVYDGPFASLSRWSEAGIVVGGISKTANAMGWRCGWLVAPPSIATQVTAIHQTVCSCAPTPGQAAALATLRALAGDGPGLGELLANLQRFRTRRDRAVRVFVGLGLEVAPTDGAFYVFVHVDPWIDDHDEVEFCRRLIREQELIAIPGRAFGHAGRGWIRLAYTSEDIEEGARRLGLALGVSPPEGQEG